VPVRMVVHVYDHGNSSPARRSHCAVPRSLAESIAEARALTEWTALYDERTMDVLTLNCGSSSVKYQLYRWETKSCSPGAWWSGGVGGSFVKHFSKGKGRDREPRLPHAYRRHQTRGRDAPGPIHGAIKSLKEIARSDTGWCTAARSSSKRAHHRRGAEDVRRALRPRAATQPGQHRRYPRRHRVLRCAAVRGHGHGVHQTMPDLRTSTLCPTSGTRSTEFAATASTAPPSVRHKRAAVLLGKIRSDEPDLPAHRQRRERQCGP